MPWLDELTRAADGDRLLTAAQVADVLNIPEYSARGLGRSGSLPVVRIGRTVRFRASSVRQWIADHESGGLAQPTKALEQSTVGAFGGKRRA